MQTLFRAAEDQRAFASLESKRLIRLFNFHLSPPQLDQRGKSELSKLSELRKMRRKHDVAVGSPDREKSTIAEPQTFWHKGHTDSSTKPGGP